MKYLYIILALALVVSCGEEEFVIYDDSQVGLDTGSTNLSFLATGDGLPKSSGITAQLIAQPRSSATSVTFQIGAESTAIEGLHYTLGGTTVSIPAGENSAALPIDILVDNFGGGESVVLNVEVTGGDNATPAAYAKAAAFNIVVLCESSLAGTYTMSSVGQGSWGCTATYDGISRWEKVGDGVYNVYTVGASSEVLDLAFGIYAPCYGYDVDAAAQGSYPNGNVQLNDECGGLFFSGASQWGEVYGFNNVSVSADGTQLILDWLNDYGEGAISTLTRTDGSTWPNLSKK